MSLYLFGCANCGHRKPPAGQPHGGQGIHVCRSCRAAICGRCDPRRQGCPGCQGRKIRTIPVRSPQVIHKAARR